MIEKVVKELSLKSFSPYGTYCTVLDPDTDKIGEEPIEFFRDMCRLNLGGDSIASFSVCRVMRRPFVVNVTEYHSYTGEGMMPLDGDVIIHVGPASPDNGDVPSEKFEVFRVPQWTLVTIHPGVWHHAPYAYRCEKVNTLIILPERTYANDCEVYELDEEKQVRMSFSAGR
jgi:ureidoglycolate lyase